MSSGRYRFRVPNLSFRISTKVVVFQLNLPHFDEVLLTMFIFMNLGRCYKVLFFLKKTDFIESDHFKVSGQLPSRNYRQKTLKYSNMVFEHYCLENVKPTNGPDDFIPIHVFSRLKT